jgi:hypothetical protein
MTIERIRELYEAEPFRAFVVHLADGRNIPVYQREFLSIRVYSRSFAVYIFAPFAFFCGYTSNGYNCYF